MRISDMALPLVAAVALTACGNDATEPEGTVPLSLSVTVGSSVPATAASVGFPLLARNEVYDDGVNELVVDYVGVVLSEVELEGALANCDGATSEEEDDDDACEEFEEGPFLLELPLDGSVDRLLEVFVAPGVYDELEFELDTPDDDDASELAFIDGHPEFDGVSVRVEGSWNGAPFVFVQDIEAEQELALSPPLEVDDDGSSQNLTLRMDISGWFLDGDQLVDPATALKDGPNEELVEDNIQRSDDEDGRDDELEEADD
jgi:hypothetical protein